MQAGCSIPPPEAVIGIFHALKLITVEGHCVRIDGQWALMEIADELKALGVPWRPDGPFTLLTRVDFEINPPWMVSFGAFEFPAGVRIRECNAIKTCLWGPPLQCSRHGKPFIRAESLGLCFLVQGQTLNLRGNLARDEG